MAKVSYQIEKKKKKSNQIEANMLIISSTSDYLDYINVNFFFQEKVKQTVFYSFETSIFLAYLVIEFIIIIIFFVEDYLVIEVE